MKRFFFEKLFAGVLASLSLFAFISCGEDTGLGSTVDTLPPELSISYPPDDAYVKGSFVFAGTCSDDKGVTRIEVSVKKLEKDGSTKDYGTSLADIKDSLTWSMEVNKSTDTGFELPDGIYKLEVTAWDRSGRKSGTIPRQFQIDNTPPVFVITKPGVNRKTFLSENSISKYGSLFAIEGTISDDHSIASMDITIYDKDGNLVAEPYSEKDISTTGGTSVTIARYIEGGIDELNTRYNDIYGVGDADASGNKIYSCTITIADSTKEYKTPGDGGIEGGNSTSVVYLYDDIYDDFMSAKKGAGLSANDFRSVLNGTATDASLAGKGIATDVTVEKVRAALNQFAKDTTNMEDDSLSFSLNPNADPTYNISGFNLNYNEAGTAIAAGTNKAMGEQPLTIIVSAGLDRVNIDPKSLKVYIKKIIDADKAHITKDTLNKSIANLVTKVSELEIDLANANESSDSSAQKEAEAQLSVIDGWNLLLDNSQDPTPSDITVTLSTELPASNYIEANAYYAIVVTGCDKDGIKLSQTKNYGFIGTVSAVPPSASFTSPKDLAYFANSKYIEGSETDKLVFTGTATENNAGMTLREITATLTVSDESSGKELPDSIQVTIKGDANNKWTKDGGLSCIYDEESHTNIWTFIPSECGEAYQKIMAVTEGLMYLYNVNIKVTGTSALSYEMSRSVHIDTTKPVVQITSVSPLVYGKEYFGEDSEYKNYTFINSSILIQGSINEVNLENVSYDVRASEDLKADLSDEKYSVLNEIKEFYTKLGVENLIDGELGKIRTLDKKIRTDLVTNYFLATGKITKDQPIKARVVFRAIDNVGNVGEYNSIESNDGEDFYIYQETNRPKVTLGNAELSYKDGETQKSLSVDTEGLNKNNLTYEHNLFGTTNNNKLSVSFSDDDSVVEYEIFIAEDGKDFKKDENGREIPFYTATPNKTSASVNCTLPENEGVYKVKILARDFIRSDAMTDENEPYGVKEIEPFYIAVDSGAPILSISNPQNGAFVSRSNGVDGGVKGTVSKKGTKISGLVYKLGDKDKNPIVTLKTSDISINEESPVNEVYNWTSEITKIPSDATNFKLEITAVDNYGQISTVISNLEIDDEEPSIGSITITNTTQNSDYSVYKSEDGRYYIHNKPDNPGDSLKFSIYGSVQDLKSGIKKIEICNGDTVLKSSSLLPIEDVEFPYESASTEYSIKATDNSGNVKTQMLDICFDNTPPQGIHAIDKSSKDIFFRISDLSNWKVENGKGEIPAEIWDTELDEDVGGKYSPTSYGNNQTVRVRGNISDSESGVNMIYYKVVNTGTVELPQEGTTIIDGKSYDGLNAIADEFLKNYKKDYSGYFSANKIEKKRIAYTSIGEQDKVYDTNGDEVLLCGSNGEGAGTIFDGYVSNFNTSNDPAKRYATITTNYDNSFTGFKNGHNYLILVAVDNVGNASLDSVNVVYGGAKTKYSNFTLNVDTETPEVKVTTRNGKALSSTDLTLLTNGLADITVGGTFDDNFSTVKSVVIEIIDDNTKELVKKADGTANEYAKITLSYSSATSPDPALGVFDGSAKTWSAIIKKDVLPAATDASYSVKATVTDRAGNESTQTIFVIQLDTNPPEFQNVKLSQVSSSYQVCRPDESKDSYFVNPNDGTFKIEGIAMDGFGIDRVELSIPGITIANNTVNSGTFLFADISLSSLTEENVKAKLTAFDKAGNSVDKEITITFDKSSPSLDSITINNVAYNTETDAINWYKDSLLNFAGIYSEIGCGIEKIDYTITKAGTSEEQTSGSFATTALSGTNAGKESFSSNLSEFITKTAGTTGNAWNTAKLVAIDKVGNRSAESEFKIYIDSEAPTIETPNTKTKLTNGKENIVISGTAYDNPETCAGLKSIVFSIKVGSTEYKSSDPEPKITAVTSENAGKIEWTATVSSDLFSGDSLSSGTYTVYATATDKAGVNGNTQKSNVATINFDKTPPTVSLNAPTDAYKKTPEIDINKSISLSGKVEDNNPLPDNNSDETSNTVKSIEYSTDYSESNPTAANWTDVSSLITSGLSIKGNYSFDLTGFDTTKFADKTKYYLRAKAVDQAGNPGYSNIVEVYVNQRSDRPVLNFINLTKNATGDYILKLNDAGTVEGTVTDDDSTNDAAVQKITVQEFDKDGVTIGSENNVTITSSGDFTFAPATKNDGAKYFKFTVLDNGGTTFTSYSNTSDYTTVPVLSVKGVELDEGQIASSSFSYKADNEVPAIDSVYALASTKTGSEESQSERISLAYVAGGTKRANVVLTINASDANGIAGMTAVIKKADGTVLNSYKSTSENKLAGKDLPTTYTWMKEGTFTSSGTTGVWNLPSLNVSELGDGTVSIIVTPYDNSGLTSNSTQQFTVDNTGPNVTNLTPVDSNGSESATQYNRTVTVKGTVTDVDSDVVSVQWYIPNETERSTWETKKTEVTWNGSESNSILEFEFKDSNLLDKYSNDTYKLSKGTDNDSGTTWYEIPIYFKTVDSLGNISYKDDYSILFNPDLDKPVSRISSPENNDLLGGAVRVNASSTVSSSVQSQSGITTAAAYIQIGSSTNYNGDDKAKSSGTYGYTVISGYELLTDLDSLESPYTSETLTDEIAKNHGFEDKAAVDSWWGIKIHDISSGGTSCKINLNETGLMNPSGDDTNNIYIRVCGVNSIGKIGSWSESIFVSINNKAPDISGKLYQFSTAPSASSTLDSIKEATNIIGEKAYESDMFVKGQWYIEATASEATGVNIENVTKVDSANITTVLSINRDYFVFDSVNTSGKVTEKKVFIKVEEAAIYKVTACDGTKMFNAVASYAINVDNTAPSVYALTGDYDHKNLMSMTKIENSNYVYTMYGAGIDDGSQIDFLAVYFKRGNNIELPLQTVGTKTGNKTSVSKGTAFKAELTDTEDNLYGVKDTSATYSNDGTYTTITSSYINDTNTFIRVGSLVKLSGSYYEIVEVKNGTAKVKATFSNTPSSAFFVAAIAVNNGTETGNTSGGTTIITEDDGDGFADSLKKATSGSFTWDLTIFSDELNDGQLDIVIVAGDKAGNYTNKISTSPTEMSEPAAEKTTVMLTNHKPRVSKVFLATDLSGNGTYDQEDFAYTFTNNGVEAKGYAYSALDSGGNEQEVATLNMGSVNDIDNKFSVRNGLAVTFEMLGASNGNSERTGGGTNLYYIPKLMTSNGATEEAKNNPAIGTTSDKLSDMSVTASGKINISSENNNVTSTNGFVLSNEKIKSISGWTASMENVTSLETQSLVQVTIWDDVNDKTTVGKMDEFDAGGRISAFGNQYTIINIPVYFDMKDDVAPKVVVNPFYWVSENENSLYGNSRKNGHIEVESDWEESKGFSNTDLVESLRDRDPKVSGKITFTGTAYDDHVLKSLSFTLVDKDGNLLDGFRSGEGPTYSPIQIVSYNPASTENDGWSALHGGSLADSGMYEWSISTVASGENRHYSDTCYLGQEGHKIYWTISIDTSKIPNVAETDIKLSVSATDQSDVSSSNAEVTSPYPDKDKTDAKKNHVPVYQMDVVPYIREIKNLFTEEAPEAARSARGYYSVYDGEEIHISGFNLKKESSDTIIALGNYTDTVTISDSNKEIITATIKSKGQHIATTGDITVTVNSVQTLNNVNKNPSFSSGKTEADAESKAMYNSLANSANNNRLTDDVKLCVWNKGFFIANTYVTDPAMKMTSNGNFYMVYDGNTGSNNAYQLKMNANAFVDSSGNKSGSTGTIKNADGGYSNFHKNAVAVDEAGNFYGASTNTDRIGNTSAKFKYYLESSAKDDEYASDSYTKKTIGYSLEQVYNDETKKYDRERVAIPKMFARDNNVYMSYFDGNHTQNPVKFRCSGSNKNGLEQNSYTPYDSTTQTYTIAQSTDDVETSTGTAKYFHVVADNTMTGTNQYTGGKYTAVGATSTGIAVVAWYELNRNRLIFSYNTDPGTPTYGGVWQTNAQEIDAGGQYVDLFVDSNDGIHIAYQSGSKLKYAYLPTYDSKINKNNVVTVDSYGTTGTYITINTKNVTVTDKDGTETTYIVPYISYQSATYADTPRAIRIAWMPETIVKGTGANTADTTGTATAVVKAGTVGNYFTEDWEVMAVPTVADTKSAIVYSGLPTSGDRWYATKDKYSPVLGYMTSSGFESAYIQY